MNIFQRPRLSTSTFMSLIFILVSINLSFLRVLADPATNAPAPPTVPAPASNASALDLSIWKLETLQGATGSLSSSKESPSGGASLVVEAQTAGSGELWLVQMDYPISVVKQKQYHLKLMMKSEPDKFVSIGLTQLHAPHAKLCEGKLIELNSAWKEIDFDFTPNADEPNARILLTNLNAPGAKFYLSNMTLSSK